MAKKTDTAADETANKYDEYDRLNKQYRSETDPVKKAELLEQCQKAMTAKLKI